MTYLLDDCYLVLSFLWQRILYYVCYYLCLARRHNDLLIYGCLLSTQTDICPLHVPCTLTYSSFLFLDPSFLVFL